MIDTENVRLQFDYDTPEAEDIRRCLNTLYSTRAGSQPLDREFGINWGFVDRPLPVAQNDFALEVIKKTEKYEKRVKVKEVKFEFDGESGKMIPLITLEGGEKVGN